MSNFVDLRTPVEKAIEHVLHSDSPALLRAMTVGGAGRWAQ